MTPRSLFAIIIKIIGIYLIVEAITFLPQLISTMYMYGRQISESPLQDTLEAGFFILLAVRTYLLTLRYCLFKTDWIIDKLHLDKGFSEEKIEINIHRSTVLKIAVIVIGGVMVVDSLPLLCTQVFTYVQMIKIHVDFKEIQSSSWITYYFVKFL